MTTPIDMVLYCPRCGLQHVDAPGALEQPPHPDGPHESCAGTWDNPPHRSHLCHGCGHIWRPADVPTNGVDEVKTQGKNDSPLDDGSPHRDKLAGRLIDAWCNEHGGKVSWKRCVEIIAIVTKMPEEEFKRLRDMQ